MLGALPPARGGIAEVGYRLDGRSCFHHEDGYVQSAPTDSIRKFVDETTTAPVTRQPSVGLGEDMRLRAARVVGSGLELDGELLQLSAFTSEDGGARAFGRIARPSRRR